MSDVTVPLLPLFGSSAKRGLELMRDWGLLPGTKALLLAALVALSLMLLIPEEDERLVVEPSAITILWSHDSN